MDRKLFVHSVISMICFDRFLTKAKSEEELQQRILTAEAQINELKTRLNESNNKKKYVENDNAVSPPFCLQ